MNDFSAIQHIIQTRRTTKPHLINGKQIPEDQVKELLHLANWAPTHGLTEPWHFVVYAEEKVKEFCRQHADLYQQHIPAEKFTADKYEKLLHMGDMASHVIIAIMQRGNLPNIPVLEEIAAAACAVQNILLGATALDISSYWGSGGMAYHPAMKTFLKLQAEDLVLGIIYLGYSDKTLTGRRNTPIHAKITFIN
ncbi:nitroreductase family protein [Adhaeribacter rhizoryzae]|uniref:Nitroreductase n=1 Tax=Adhaeribacter rhizoryzae TaxID=2607907 RepID=A0A5M6DGP5_9BACT|nr:nitroreductase [Adhaeribacter rhizoryzae]KAA5546708.1 nitroreductase [Adhaeribacter rhizoryzae]